MRPLYLKLSAFGSYAGEETIDFSRMEKGIFLVTGDTGSGKTTIFDGIVYALYDRTSGGVRDGNMMRSAYADLRTPTFVELRFSCRGEIFRVVRNPDYERVSLRKDKNGNIKKTQEKSKAELFLPDGSLFRGNKKEVNQKIQEIVGMDARQFMQMAMIAQGDFLKLLLAKSEERKEIFSRLFDTRIFGRLEEELKNREKEEYAALKEVEHACQEQMGRILYPKEQAGSESLVQLREQMDVNGALSCLETFIGTDGKQNEILEKEHEGILKMLASSGRKKELSEELLTIKKQLAVQEEWLRSNLPREAVLRKEEEQAAKREKEAAETYERCLRTQEEKRRVYEEMQENIKERLSGLEALALVWEQLDAQAEKQKKLAVSWEEANQEYRRSRSGYEEMYEAFLREQAGILARDLKEGIPCPVCGSTKHPALAEPALLAPSQSQLNEARKKTAQQEKKREQAGKAFQEGEKESHGILVSLKQEGSRLFGESFDPSKQDWRKEAQAALSEVREEKESLQINWKKQTGTFQRERDRLEKEQKTFRKAYLSAREQLEEFIRQTERTKGGILSAREQIKRLILQWEALGEQEPETDHLKAVVQEQENILQELKSQEALLQKRQKEVYSRLESNKRTKELLTAYQKEYEERTIRFVQIRHLSQTACGTLKGSVKLDFESYIQRQYFKRVIGRANVRLMQMSAGQFLLKCKDLEQLSIQGKAGLDLDVYSLATQSERDVKTLSGGESFMAALAMALGLADVVSETVGAIRLDTMFIDEGFGSLDDHAREQAVRVLYELCGENRLIGIISHVSELKEQIEEKLVVTKGKQGSHTRWIR